MRLVETNYEPDGAKCQKIYTYFPEKKFSGFYINDKKVTTIVERLNCKRENTDWLSLRPLKSSTYFKKDGGGLYFGEFSGIN